MTITSKFWVGGRKIKTLLIILNNCDKNLHEGAVLYGDISYLGL